MDDAKRRQKIAELHSNGLTTEQIAKRLGIPESRVSLELNILDVNGLLQEKRFSAKIYKRRLKIAELSNKGLSATQIAQELHISTATVYQDIAITGCVKTKHTLTEERRAKVAELYAKGLTGQAIADEVNTSVAVVYADVSLLTANGTICAKPKPNAEERMQKIIELHNKGFTNNQISKELGIAVTTVVRAISEISKSQDSYKLVKHEGGRSVSSQYKTNVPSETLYNLRLRGLTNAEIAELFDVHPNTIASSVAKYRERHNLPYPPNSPNSTSECKLMHIDMRSYQMDAYRLYKAGVSYEKIAGALGVPVQDVYSAVRTVSIMQYLEEQEKSTKCNQERDKHGKVDDLMPEIVALYNSGFSHKDMAAKLNISTSYVNQLIRRAFRQGLLEHNREGARKTSLDLMPNVVELYKSGCTFREIAMQLGMTVTDVGNIIRTARRRGLLQLNPASQGIPEDVKKTFLQLRAQGKTVSEIATIKGEPYNRVLWYLTKSKDGTKKITNC